MSVSHGFDHHHHELQYDHLVIGLGSITNFYNLPGLAECALTMKSLGDAIHFGAISPGQTAERIVERT